MGKPNEKIGKNSLIVVLAVLVVVLVGLIIGNIVVFVQENFLKGGVSGHEQTYTAYVIGEDGKETPLAESEIGVPERSWSVATTDKTLDEVVAEYQALIDAAPNQEDKLKLYNERISYIYSTNEWSERGDLIVADLIAVDDILQNVDSAVRVENAAAMAGNQEIKMQYDKIVQERVGPDANYLEEGEE